MTGSRSRLASAYTLALVLIVGCSDGADGSSGTTFDTLGDTIVARTGNCADTTPHLLVSDLVIGEADGADEYTFGVITEVAVTRNGSMFVWDGQARTLRLYDSTGSFLKQVGRQGAGPGEYGQVNGMAVRPDGRLAAWDATNARISLFSQDGEFEAQWPMTGGHFTSRALVADTANNVYVMSPIARDTSRPLGIMGYIRFSPDGGTRDTLAAPAFGVEPQQLTARVRGGISSRPVPFAPSAPWTMSTNGYFVGGPGDPYVIFVLRQEARPIRIERTTTSVAVEPGERDEQREFTLWLLRLTDPNYQWNGPEIPETKPAYNALQVDLDGRIWAQVSQPGERIPESDREQPRSSSNRPVLTWRQPTAFDVFAPDGEFLGTVRVPYRTTVLAARGNHVWAYAIDSLDTPTLTRYRIEPSLRR